MGTTVHPYVGLFWGPDEVIVLKCPALCLHIRHWVDVTSFLLLENPVPRKAHLADFLHFALCVTLPSLFMLILLLSNYSLNHKSFFICITARSGLYKLVPGSTQGVDGLLAT